MKTAWQTQLEAQIKKKKQRDEWSKKMLTDHRIKLFFAGMIQIFFVAVNVYMVAHMQWLGVLFTSFCLSSVWAFNVQRVAPGDFKDGFTYAAGASVGTMLGMLSTYLIYQ